MNLYEHLTKKLQDNKRETLLNTIFKFCDTCQITYPEHIVICDKCGNEQLRSFKVHNNDNLEEIEKNRHVKFFCYNCGHDTEWMEYHLVAGHRIYRVEKQK